ncbi:hypothetical protein D9758_018098 [Tetrapyrgos nigripes]|uniref:Uncharacterized protein n=1 Tax=Tetrapyrgos nigripes TaxID=182062 RepID=A0A8H5BIQ0_9AGAR|nr:hypothetical protein D9758_018098 [Tetrapyrgos nigripes]
MSCSFDSMNPPPRSEGIPDQHGEGDCAECLGGFRFHVGWGYTSRHCTMQPWCQRKKLGGGGQASGVKVVKEGKRRVKGRLGSRAEDASLVLGFGASLSSAEHSLVLVSVSTMNNISNGNLIIASYGAYLHIKLCDFGISGELVFIYTNTFAGTTSGLYRSALDDG